MRILKSTLLLATAGVLLSSCGSSVPPIVSTPIENIDAIPLKVGSLSDDEMKSWAAADLMKDTVPGMSVDRAYAEILKGRKGKKVIVGVIDSGIDIEHEDLKDIAEGVDVGDPEIGKKYNEIDDIKCPVCPNSKMLKMVDAKQPHIWFESCPTCYGRFYDAGEFKDFSEHTLSDFIKRFTSKERK